MKTFYVDETGFTGEDLLASDQPIFAQATNDLLLDEATRLITEVFASVGASELKHKQLSRNGRYRQCVVELIRILAADPKRVGVWIAHKEFALTTLIVDWWMEPLADRGGLNLYKDGGNLAMANMLYLGLQGLWDETFRRRF